MKHKALVKNTKPKHAEVHVSFWLDQDLNRQLISFAHSMYKSKSVVLRDALIHYINATHAEQIQAMARVTNARRL